GASGGVNAGWASEEGGAGGGLTDAPRPNALDGGAVSAYVSLDELAATSGLSHSKIMELQQFGLIEPFERGALALYDADAVIVARVAAGFLAHGLEPRHLRAYKSAAEREAGLLEQRIMPLVMQRTPQSLQQSQDVLAELINLGSELRRSLLRKALASHTGNR
ncbi:MAG: hypothetical protein OXF64_01745, partial [bacterium]|nr:hypothetical protein [bacterium]